MLSCAVAFVPSPLLPRAAIHVFLDASVMLRKLRSVVQKPKSLPQCLQLPLQTLLRTDARLPVTVSFDHFLVIDRRICRLINEQAYSAS